MLVRPPCNHGLLYDFEKFLIGECRTYQLCHRMCINERRSVTLYIPLRVIPKNPTAPVSSSVGRCSSIIAFTAYPAAFRPILGRQARVLPPSVSVHPIV